MCFINLQEVEEEEEKARRPATREVSFEAARRVRVECAHPAVLHFYSWLLQARARGGCACRANCCISTHKRTVEYPAHTFCASAKRASVVTNNSSIPASFPPRLPQGYRTNAPFTNHAILSFFRRIADPHQLNLEPMLYQARACLAAVYTCADRCITLGGTVGGQLLHLVALWEGIYCTEWHCGRSFSTLGGTVGGHVL